MEALTCEVEQTGQEVGVGTVDERWNGGLNRKILHC